MGADRLGEREWSRLRAYCREYTRDEIATHAGSAGVPKRLAYVARNGHTMFNDGRAVLDFGTASRGGLPDHIVHEALKWAKQ